MPTLRLRGLEVRLLFLAIQYHLDRPGAELDPTTGRPASHGLAELAPRLLEADDAEVSLSLTPFQARRADSAILGAINELKVYPMLAPDSARSGRSAAPRFEATLHSLWPQVADDPEEALALVPALVALRRRLLQALDEPGPRDEPSRRRPFWRFWSR